MRFLRRALGFILLNRNYNIDIKKELNVTPMNETIKYTKIIGVKTSAKNTIEYTENGSIVM